MKVVFISSCSRGKTIKLVFAAIFERVVGNIRKMKTDSNLISSHQSDLRCI